MSNRLFTIGTLAAAVNHDPEMSNCEALLVESGGGLIVINKVDWWTGARLCLSSEAAGEASEELGFGTLVEMVDMAMSRPRDERPRLSIRMELSAADLLWADIIRLAQRPDKPTMI